MKDPQEPGARTVLWAHTEEHGRSYQAGRDQYIHIWEGSQPDAIAPQKVVNTLGRGSPAFTGRDHEIEELINNVRRAKASSGVLPVHAIDGMPGVGKTAFAIHVGHLLAPQFPDGQILLDLCAHTEGRDPVAPLDALASLLKMVNIPAGRIPIDLNERSALWRTEVAERSMLLILDNVASYAQIEHLLPGSPFSLVLVTSRRRLAALEAAPLALETLSPEESVDMFIRLSGRGDNDSDSVAKLVQRCGYLPLAIALLGGRFRTLTAWTVPDLIADMEKAPQLLSGMRAEDRAVDAAFSLSYRHLLPAQRHMFQHLGLNPGEDITAEAAAALADISTAEAADSLRDLHIDHLIEERVRGRYRMHDLMRSYSAGLAKEDAADFAHATRERLFVYYTETATNAEIGLATSWQDSHSAYSEALQWFSAEHSNLLACARYAASNDHHIHVIWLAAHMADFLTRVGPWDEAINLHIAAVDASIYLSDRSCEARALNNLGVVLRLTGYYPKAIEALQRAFELSQSLDDQQGQADSLNRLGAVLWLSGDCPRATKVLGKALEIYQHLVDLRGQAETLYSIAGVHRITANYTGAAAVLSQALGYFDALADHRGRAHVLNRLGVILESTGDHGGAAEAFTAALTIFQDLGDESGQADAMDDLGAVMRLKGEYASAAPLHERALVLYRALGDRRGQADALDNLGFLRILTGDPPGATRALQQALDLFELIGDHHGQAEVLNHLGLLHLTLGRIDEATATHRRAEALASSVGSQIEEARAQEGLGRCELAAGDIPNAKIALLAAQKIYEEIGATTLLHEVVDLLKKLATLPVTRTRPPRAGR